MNKGFTLIEMLLVVAIIGFLVAILLPSVAGVGADAKDKEVQADLRTLKSAVEVYYIGFGEYPDSTDWGLSSNVLLAADGTGSYARLVDQFPADPYEDGTNGCDTSYDYVVDAVPDGRTYIIATDKSATAAPTVPQVDEADANDAAFYVTNARIVTK